MEQQHLTRLETQVKELDHSLANLTNDKDFQEFLKIIHRPGWTTPAEQAFVTGIVDSMLAQTKALTGLKQALMTGSREVVVK
jgi:hypothetical protein